MDDTRSPDLKHLGIEPVEISRTLLTGAGTDNGEVRVSLSRVKFGETKVDAVTARTAHPSTERPRLKPQRGRPSKQSNRTGKTKWG